MNKQIPPEMNTLSLTGVCADYLTWADIVNYPVDSDATQGITIKAC